MVQVVSIVTQQREASAVALVTGRQLNVPRVPNSCACRVCSAASAQTSITLVSHSFLSGESSAGCMPGKTSYFFWEVDAGAELVQGLLGVTSVTAERDRKKG